MAEEIFNSIKAKLNEENTLAKEVAKGKWDRKSRPFEKISSSSTIDFPELSIPEMKLLFNGSYQLAQSLCYLAEILDSDDNINIDYLKVSPNILKFKVQSRHKNSAEYKCYLDYSSNINNIEGVKRCCCSCANGWRTTGTCCHVASIIFYLSYARYQVSVINPFELLSHIFDVKEIEDIIPAVSDSEDSSDEDAEY